MGQEPESLQFIRNAQFNHFSDVKKSKKCNLLSSCIHIRSEFCVICIFYIPYEVENK